MFTHSSSVATGYGQPSSTIYDWAMEPPSLKDADYHLPGDLAIRLRIEKFCDRVTKALYSSKPEPGEFTSTEKLVIVQILESELREMEVEFGRDISGMFCTYRTCVMLPLTLSKRSIRSIYGLQSCTFGILFFLDPTLEAMISRSSSLQRLHSSDACLILRLPLAN